MRTNSLLWEQFTTQREKIVTNLQTKLVQNMAALIGNEQTADLILIAADGQRMPAHACILRQRAPVFFNRHIVPNLHRKKPGQVIEIIITDVDYSGLSFFIRSVYTDEEIVGIEQNLEDSKDDRESPGPSMEANFEVDDEYDQPGGSSSNRSSNKDVTPRNDSTKTSPKKSLSRETDSGYHQQENQEKDEPLMTSFRDLALSDSPMCLSGYSDRNQYDIVEEDENDLESSNFGQHGRFIRLEDSGIVPGSGSVGPTSRTQSPIKRKSSTKIFPMFIGFTGSESEMSQSLPEPTSYQSPYSSTQTLSAGSIRGRAMLARRLSVSSLTSLTSIDLTPTTESIANFGDKMPCSKLAADLLEMYQKNIDADVLITTDDGDLHAHKCILWATCPTFRKLLKKSNKIEICGFSKNSINFLLTFLYGGLTTIPDDIEIWEVVSLATHLGIEELSQVASLYLKTYKCHFFHRPCATCVSAVFDALPQFKTIKCLNRLYSEALSWQAKHFSRIWKGRVFLHLNEEWQKECRDALIADIHEENIIDVLLGCEKLQASLPRIKSIMLADTVQTMVGDVVEYCTDFLISSFDLIVGSKSFKTHGRGLALNLALLEDVLPTLVHSLSAETSIRTFITLRDLLIEISNEIEKSPRRKCDSMEFLSVTDYSQRFIHLVRRLFESTDKHLLHYAFSIVKSDAYELLSKDEQQRIEECGIFVEMRMPKAPPPKLSSFNRNYKRSSSCGIGIGSNGRHDRTRSLERSRPIISQVIEASEKEEMAREKSFIDTHRRANSMKEARKDLTNVENKSLESNFETEEKPIQTSSQTLTTTKIPAPIPKRVPSSSAIKQPIKKGPPPIKKTIPTKTVLSNQEQFLSERQTTQTIITVQQHKELGLNPDDLGVPTVSNSPKIKPKSVVRPMPKNPPLAATIPITSLLPQMTASKPEAVIPSSLRGRPLSSKSTKQESSPSNQRQKPRSALSRPTASSAARSAPNTGTSVDRTKRASVESKIPKVRA